MTRTHPMQTATLMYQRTWLGSQDINCELIFDDNGSRYRISMHIDVSYQEQSRCTVERWDGNRWQRVVYRAGATLECYEEARRTRRSVNAGHEELTIEPFEPDVSDMFAEAVLIVEGTSQP